MGDGYKELLPFGHEETCPGAWSSLNLLDPLIMIRIFLLDHVDEPASANYVNTSQRSIVKEVVRVGHNLHRVHEFAGLGINRKQARRHAAANKQPMMGFVERHRETCLRSGGGPTGEDRALYKVGNLDLLLVGDIHENASSCLLKLERFGVGIHDYLPDQLSPGIQNPQRPGSLWPSSQRLFPAISDDHSATARIVANIVGIVGELHRVHELKCRAIENFRSAINTVGGVQAMGRIIVKQSLRLRQTRQRPDSLAGLQVEHLDSVVAQGGHEEALAFHI